MGKMGRNLTLLAVCVAIGAVGYPVLMSRANQQATARPADASCTGPLTGRTITIPASTVGFSSLQYQQPLPLKAGEYVLTIDDGPNAATTKELLGILDSNCVHATFFMVGKRAEANPDLAKLIVAEGQGVASHSYSHGNFSKMTLDQVHEEIAKGDAAVFTAAYGDKAPKGAHMFRIPGAVGVPRAIPAEWMAFLKSKQLILASYDISPEDWKNSPPDESFARMFGRLPDRGVIVMHDWASNTPELMRRALAEFERRKAKLVTLKVAGGT